MEKNTTIKQSWYNFYKDKCNEEYYNYICCQYKPFIDEIEKEMKNNFSVAEFGCGMGNITKYLINNIPYNYYTMLDNDMYMIEMARAKFIDIESSNTAFDLFDITIPYYEDCDLIHSHGVLEHFEDYQIKRIIELQLDVAPLLIHYVPSDKYDYKSFGDERLLSKEYWRENFKPTEIIEFNSGYDLILKWRK